MSGPRFSTFTMLTPATVALPAGGAQVLPPSVLTRRPVRKPPPLRKKFGPAALPSEPADVRPAPAIKVLWVGSVGSSAKLEIDSDAWLSVNGVQVVPPLRVTQTPPFTAPTYKVLGSLGSGATALMALASVPFRGSPGPNGG